MHRYLLCGWQTHSQIPLTSLPTSLNDGGDVDVVIEVATCDPPFPKSTGCFVFQHSAEYSLIKVESIADFEIREGRQIRVWPTPGVARKDIEIFLFGLAWATLCHQRGLLPLHASAIVTGKGIAAFTGHSGAGKSTTAALLGSLGYEMIADDILPVSFNQHAMPGAWPYLRRLKLHHETIAKLAFTPAEVVSEKLDSKRYFVQPKSTSYDKWRRLDRLYLLENEPSGKDASIERLTGADAVRAIVDQTYHLDFILGTRRFGDHLAFCTRLASKVPIYRMRRPQSSEAGCSFRSRICAHLDGAAKALSCLS
jgi:hypothetical protein